MLNYTGFQNRFRKELEDPQVKNYLNLGLTLITIILLTIFALKPAFLTVYELSLKLGTAKQRSQELKNKINLLSQAQENFNKASGDIPIILEALPNEPNLVKAVEQLNNTAISHGLEITKLETGNTPLVASQSAQTAEQTKLIVGVEGPLNLINDYLRDIEKLPRVMRVEKFEMESRENIYAATITVYAFYQK